MGTTSTAGRLIAFVGNCQAEALAGVYRRRIAPFFGDAVVNFEAPPGHEIAGGLPPEHPLHRADIIVDQKFDGPDPLPPELFARPTLRRVRFPHLAGRFYWPFGGVRHALAPDSAVRQIKQPYPEEMGDAILNKLIAEGVAPGDVMARYDAAVAEAGGRVARMAELHLQRQRDRDAACGMAFADVIEQHYQDEQLFLTQGHPGLLLSRLLVGRVFTAMAVPSPLVDLAVRSLDRSPFPLSEMPLHPRVAELLGLRFVTPERRYRYENEGHLTFEEYALRYMVYGYVPEMRQAIEALGNRDLAEGLAKMREALLQCEGTATAWQIYAAGLQRAERLDEAEAAIRRAMQLQPAEPETFATAAAILARRGDLDGALAAADQAIAQFPGNTEGHRRLAYVLAQAGRSADVVAVTRLLSGCEPGNLDTLHLLARHLRLSGRTAQADATLAQVLALDPDNDGARTTLTPPAPPAPPAPSPQPAALPAAPALRRYRVRNLAALAADAALRLEHFADSTLALPPAAFGAADPHGAAFAVHPAAPAWLLRDAVVHGHAGVVTLGDVAIAETLVQGVPIGDGWVELPDRSPDADVHTGFHLLGARHDDYARWLLDIVARFGGKEFLGFGEHPGAPVALLPALNMFWKWESLDVILPKTLARLSVGAASSVAVQRLFYVPPLGGAGFATHPDAGKLFDLMRERVVGPVGPVQGDGRRLFIGADDEAAALAARYGFERVAAERLPFAEQIRLFVAASHVVAESGPALANLVFCRLGATVCELRPEGAAYRHLAALRGLRYGSAADRAALQAVLGDQRFG